MNKTYVLLDVETTGLHIPGDKVIKVSLLKVLADGSEEKLVEFVNPGKPIPPEITEINGISDEDVADAPYFTELVEKFDKFINGAPILGYRLKSFDLPMFLKELYSCGKTINLKGGFLDLWKVYLEKEPRHLRGAYEHLVGKYDKKNNC